MRDWSSCSTAASAGGIGVIGVFTATVASFFLEQDAAPPPANDVAERLAALERKVDELLARSDRQRTRPEGQDSE